MQVETPIPLSSTGLCHSSASIDSYTSDTSEDDIDTPPYSPAVCTTDEIDEATPSCMIMMSEDDEDDHGSSLGDTTSEVVSEVIHVGTMCTHVADVVSNIFCIIVQDLYESETAMEHTTGAWLGYKFVGDNIDKNIKPSLQRHELHGQSLHFFHGYAVRDRLDLSRLSDKPPPSSPPDACKLIPSESDLSHLIDELVTIISR